MNIKQAVTFLAAASLSLLVSAGVVSASNPHGDKVTICHAAGREGTTQYVTLTIGYQAVYGPGGHFNENGTTQAGHEDDYFGPCQVDTTTTVAPTTTVAETTTTVAETTTTTEAPTTTVEATTTTTVAEQTTTTVEASTSTTEAPVVTTTIAPDISTPVVPEVTATKLPQTGAALTILLWAGLIAGIGAILLGVSAISMKR